MIRRRDLGTMDREAEAGEEDKGAAELRDLRMKAALEGDEEVGVHEQPHSQGPEIR